MQRIAVIGAGAWGTALAVLAQRAGCETVLWARRGEQAADLPQMVQLGFRHGRYWGDWPQ